jgi:succinate dehydrogenase/fumarate reductase flavoprotein subunit
MALELGHLALAGEVVCAAALRRDESRGQHYRDDFRESAPAGLRWTVATGDGDRVTLEDRPVPGAGLDFEAALAAARGARP